MFSKKVASRESGILLYGITPPKAHHKKEKIEEITVDRINLLQSLELDGLVIYDLQDESSRTKDERPFPFYCTLDPFLYATQYLHQLNLQKIIYRSVGKYGKNELKEWVETNEFPTVFVGSPSREQPVNIKLPEAYNIWNNNTHKGILGGVTIPERHILHENEHLRILHKMEDGCSFFISQCVFNVECVKNVLSELYYHCQKNQIACPTIIFTLTTCGSIKTLEFLNWLGIHLPSWLKNELYHSHDILAKSIDLSLEIAEGIIRFCMSKDIPCGLNIESVSLNKEEIAASEYLLKHADLLLQSVGLRKKQLSDIIVS